MTRLMWRLTLGLGLGLMLLPIGIGLAQASNHQESLSNAEQDTQVECVAAPDINPPPFDMAPKPVSGKGNGNGAPTLDPDTFKPVCPEGQVPMPKAFYSKDKGNPLFSDEKLYSFDEIYGHGDNQNEEQQTPPPPPPKPTPGAPECNGVAWYGSCYYYANAADLREADGGGMTTIVYNPTYVTFGAGGHTLNEIAVQGGPANGHIIELGWNVSSEQYGDIDPHLFVYHWIDRIPTCYDGCGWVQYSTVYFPGMNLSAIIGMPVYIGYVYYAGNWWAWFDNQWLGYFPGSEWSGAYTTSTMIQWFGEVASLNGIPPGTDMGNGLFPSDLAAAVMSTLCDVDASDWVCWYYDEQEWSSTVPRYYYISHTGFGEMRYGGPGE